MPRVFCILRWVRVQKVDNPAAKKIVDATFALEVSLLSSYYITKDELRSFGLAPLDDDENNNFPSVASTPSTAMPSRPATGAVPVASLVVLPVVVETVSDP